MRSFVIASLCVAEFIVGCEIVSSSVALSTELRRSAAVGHVAAAVIRSTRHLALELRSDLRRLS